MTTASILCPVGTGDGNFVYPDSFAYNINKTEVIAPQRGLRRTCPNNLCPL